MLTITWVSFFRFLHVASAIFFIGPHFVLALMVRHILKNPESAPTLLPLVDKAGLFPAIGAPMMFVTGLLMIAFGNGWSAFRELWLSGAVVIFLLMFLNSAVRVGPAFKAMTEALQNGPIKPDEFKVLSGRMNAGMHVQSVAMVLIVILMILKPTL
jgi:hypothetical protein